ncbi:MAG: MFS transporter, partial [Candidatus Peribacter sp.]|nr:MFS transporter [Candidatus Peribacter sp.]
GRRSNDENRGQERPLLWYSAHVEAQRKHLLRANIWKLYLMNGLQESLLIVGVLFPFLQANGITTQQFFLLQGTHSIMFLLLQIPSGYLSDQWGRKNTLIVAALASIIGMFLFAIGTAFWQFLLAEALLAVWSAFQSGTIEALMYESLANGSGETNYRVMIGNLMVFSWGSQMTMSLIAGTLAALLGLRAVAWLTLPFMIGAFFVALTLREPIRHRLRETQHLKTMFRIAGKALSNVPLRTVIILSSTLSAMTFAMVWFTQTFQQMVHFPLRFFGVPNAIALLLGILVSQITSRLMHRMDDRLLYMGIVAVVVLCFFWLSAVHGMIGIAILLLGRASYGAIRPLVTDLVSKMTTTETRATVLSLNGFAEKLFFGIASPFIGYLADLYSLNTAIFFTAIVGGLAAVVYLFQMISVWKEIPV